MAKHKKKPAQNKITEKRKKFNIKEYLPIAAIILAVALLVGGILLFTGNEEPPEQITYNTAAVYFIDNNNQMALETTLVNANNQEEGVIKALVKGPGSTALKKAVEGDVKVLSVSTKDGLCTINLSKEFADKNSGDNIKEANAVYSIVNSLCMLGGVDKVKINVNSDAAYKLNYIALDKAFEPDWNMVRFEDRPQ